jgi:hypothetical protein
MTELALYTENIQKAQDEEESAPDKAERQTDGSIAAGAADMLQGSSTGSGTIRNTVLPKGSDVTAIAKEAGPSIVGIRMTISGTRYNYSAAPTVRSVRVLA